MAVTMTDLVEEMQRRGVAAIKAGKAPKAKKPPFKGRKPAKRKARKHVDPR